MQTASLRNIDWACARFDASRDAVYAWVRAGLIPHCRIGKRIFFDEDAISAFIARGGRASPEPQAELNGASP
jgi:excisionase family DNA binding protein